MAVSIELLTADHWPDVERIHAAGIATGHATFDTEPPTWEHLDAVKLPGQRLVAVDNENVVG
jgi:L-amino acid N-acyltransferase YncA